MTLKKIDIPDHRSSSSIDDDITEIRSDAVYLTQMTLVGSVVVGRRLADEVERLRDRLHEAEIMTQRN